jgi:protein transport protein SEC24
VRTFYMRIIKSVGVSAMVELLYPRMYSLHRLAKEDALPDANGHLRIPALMRTSYARMEVHGAYLIGARHTV